MITPDPWPPPEPHEGEVRIVPLTREIVDLDVAAYTSSPRAITAHSAGRWPVEGFTREEDLRLIELHEREHAAGEAYAYAVLSGAGEVGCAYLRPLAGYVERTGICLDVADGAAIATFWLVDDEATRPRAGEILQELRAWVRSWGAAPVVFRCLPEEAGSVSALSAAVGMRRLDVGEQRLPYLWFEDERAR